MYSICWTTSRLREQRRVVRSQYPSASSTASPRSVLEAVSCIVLLTTPSSLCGAGSLQPLALVRATFFRATRRECLQCVTIGCSFTTDFAIKKTLLLHCPIALLPIQPSSWSPPNPLACRP